MQQRAKPDTTKMRSAADAVRDVKNWVALFAAEHELSDEAQKVLHKKLDELVDRIRAIECK